MSPTNREIQLRKTCQLYAYVLSSIGEEVPDAILECTISYDYPVECMNELVETIKGLDEETFEKLISDRENELARDLEQWWQMYQMYIPIER